MSDQDHEFYLTQSKMREEITYTAQHIRDAVDEMKAMVLKGLQKEIDAMPEPQIKRTIKVPLEKKPETTRPSTRRRSNTRRKTS